MGDKHNVIQVSFHLNGKTIMHGCDAEDGELGSRRIYI